MVFFWTSASSPARNRNSSCSKRRRSLNSSRAGYCTTPSSRKIHCKCGKP
jgi:hypothetical protein